MKFTKIKETCIYVNDLDSSRSFYHDALGMELISQVKDRHVFFRAGESVLLCFIASQTEKEVSLPPHGARGSIHFALEVERGEYEKAKDDILEKSINILHEHEWKQGLRSFYFHDPDKNLVEVIEKGVWEIY